MEVAYKNLTMSPGAARLFGRDDTFGPSESAQMLAAVARVYLGPYGIAMEHFREGQSKWPRLADSTLKAKSPVTEKFVQSGRVKKALQSFNKSAIARTFGSSADAVSGGKNIRYNATSNGVFVRISSNVRNARLTVGFVGKLKLSREFNKARREIAKSYGKRAKDISIRTVQERNKGIRKFEAKGALGLNGRKQVLARGGDNLAYANIVQAGAFAGGSLENKRTGRRFNVSAQDLPKYKKDASVGNFIEARKGQPRPLLPFTKRDEAKVLESLQDAFRDIMATREVVGGRS